MAASNNSTRNDPRRAVLTPEGYRPASGVSQRWDTTKQRMVSMNPIRTPNAILTPTGYVNVTKIKVPKFTLTEALDLSRYGYTGMFKAGSKETIGLKGAAWQQYQALQALRDKAKIAPYQALETARIVDAYKQGLAAKPITPGNKLFNDITTLNTYFTDKYGSTGEKYAGRYGHLPTQGTKYGILFDLNNPKIRTDAAMSMYQNDLASYATAKGKELAAGTYADPIAQANAAQLSSELIAMGQDYTVKRSKWNKDKIGELEQALDMQTGGYKWNPKVVAAVGSSPPPLNATALSSTLATVSGPMGAILGSNDTINENANKVLTTLSNVGSSSLLAPENIEGNDNPFDIVGKTFANTVKGLSRMAIGLPMGFYAVADSLTKTGENLLTGNFDAKNTWNGVDTALFEGVKTDYTARYKTPFDSGVTDSESWKTFGQTLAQDPTMPILDILSIIPVVGQIAKGASIASTIGKAGAIGLDASRAASLARAEGLVAKAAEGGKVPASRLAEAVDTVESLNDVMISKRRYRQLARKALAGDYDATKTLDGLRRQGLVLPDGKNSVTLRFAAKFEPRMKVMKAPSRAIGNTTDGPMVALKRYPASPLVRGIGQGFEYLARTIDDKAGEALTSTDGALSSKTAGKIAEILVRIPGASYQWQYGRALKSNVRNFWGDTATDKLHAETIMRLQKEGNFDTSVEQAALSRLAGGTGAFPSNHPAIQRAAIERAIADAGEDVTKTQLDTWNAQLKALPEITDYDAAAIKLDEHMFDPTKHADDKQIVDAAKVVREMEYQQSRVQKIVSSDMNPLGMDYLKSLFSEALVGLGLHERSLWGDTGELTQFIDDTSNQSRFVSVNDNYHYNEFATSQNVDLVINSKFENIFDNIKDARTRKRAIDNTHEAIRMLSEDGVFHDASGPSNVKGAPVLIMAKSQRNVPKGFVAVNRLKLDGSIVNGRATRKALYDSEKPLIVPKEFLKTDKNNNPVMLSAKDAKAVAEQGAFNAMGDIFPNAHFYSDKVAETGLLSVTKNYADLASEHVIATNALKEHTLLQHTQSQIQYLTNRIERDLEPMVMANAELIRADKLVGKASKNYRILKSVGVFSTLEEAQAFARARGIDAKFQEDLAKFRDNPDGAMVGSVFDLEAGFGTIMHDGELRYAVRGDVRDWAGFAKAESASKLKDYSMYQRVLYDELENIGTDSNVYVLAVPKSIDKVVQAVVTDANNHASKLLSNPLVSGPTNIFKRLVLNMNPKFIGNNVIGGMAMLMMRNPMAAGNILIKGLEAASKRSGTTYWKNLSKDLKVLNHHMAYEIEHNVCIEMRLVLLRCRRRILRVN